jgi:hypothetical protein
MTLSKPISVGRSFGEPGFLCVAGVTFVLTVITILVAFAPNKDAREEAPKLFIFCFPACLWVLYTFVRIRRCRRWIVDTGTGFTYTDYLGESHVLDEQVSGLGSRLSFGFVRGLPKVTTRSAVVAIDGKGGRRFEVNYSFRSRVPDQLGSLFERLERRVVEQATQSTQSGGLVYGEGWAIDRVGLWLQGDDDPHLVPFARVSASEIVDRHACVWVVDSSEPVLRVPDGSVNARVLVHLVGLQATGVLASSDISLGRLLFRRDHGWRSVGVWAGYVGVASLMLCGVILGARDKNVVDDGTAILGVLAVLLGGIAVLTVRVVLRKKRFECFSNGVRLVTGWRGARELKFDDVRSFTYSSVRRTARTSAGSAYLGTWYTIEFQTNSGDRSLSFTFTTTTRDVAIDELRDLMAKRIASVWGRMLETGQSRRWTDRLTFTSDGLDIRGRKTPIPLAQIGSSLFQNGYWYLYHIDSTLLVREACSTPNFFPGYFLLAGLKQSRE